MFFLLHAKPTKRDPFLVLELPDSKNAHPISIGPEVKNIRHCPPFLVPSSWRFGT